MHRRTQTRNPDATEDPNFMFHTLRRVLILLAILAGVIILFLLSRQEKVQRVFIDLVQKTRVTLTKEEEEKKIRFILRGTVSRVRTGDTFDLMTVSGVNMVRLAGVRAPEMPLFSAPSNKVSPEAFASQQFLTKAALGCQVEVKVIDVVSNRWLLALAEVDGSNLNVRVLESRMASLHSEDLTLMPLAAQLTLEESARKATNLAR
jgi:endonuclease YncB( thermonuclease family)